MNWESLRAYDETVRHEMAGGNYRNALEALVCGYQHILIGFCANMLGDQEPAEELAQDVFLAAFRAMSGYRGEASVRTWLFAIARKQCYKALRKRRQRGRIEREKQEIIAEQVHRTPTGSPEENLETEFWRIRQGLNRLDKGERSLLLMRYDTGIQITELGHILGISVASVRRRLARALDHLREVINDDAE